MISGVITTPYDAFVYTSPVRGGVAVPTLADSAVAAEGVSKPVESMGNLVLTPSLSTHTNWEDSAVIGPREVK